MSDTKHGLKAKKFNEHAIRTQMIKHKAKYSAFVTWNGMDLKEYGETERNAVFYLLHNHMKFLGIQESDIVPCLHSLGFY